MHTSSSTSSGEMHRQSFSIQPFFQDADRCSIKMIRSEGAHTNAPASAGQTGQHGMDALETASPVRAKAFYSSRLSKGIDHTLSSEGSNIAKVHSPSMMRTAWPEQSHTDKILNIQQAFGSTSTECALLQELNPVYAYEPQTYDAFVSDRQSPMKGHSRAKMIKELTLKLAATIHARGVGPSDDQQSHRVVIENATSSGPSAASSSVGPSLVKRKRDTAQDHSDDDDGNDPSQPRLVKRQSAGHSTRFWACPYTKFDPMRYSERNANEKIYRKCSGAMLNNISRLKQHLRRAHMAPHWYCPRCYSTFSGREKFHDHVRSEERCEVQPTRFQETMTDGQLSEILSQRQNNAASWYMIYATLFPNAPKPTSPYVSVSDPVSIQRFIELFGVIGPAEFLGILRERTRPDGLGPSFNTSLQVMIEETFEVAFPEYLDQLRTQPWFLLEENWKEPGDEPSLSSK